MHKNCDRGTTTVFAFVYLFGEYPKLVTNANGQVLTPLTPSDNRIAEEKCGYDRHRAKNRSR